MCNGGDFVRWADVCSEDTAVDSHMEQEEGELCTNAIVLADEVAANPLMVIRRGVIAEEKNWLVEEKMLDIAGILGIIVEGRIEEIHACICGMIAEEFGRTKGYENSKIRRKPKGSRELANLASLIIYDRQALGRLLELNC